METTTRTTAMTTASALALYDRAVASGGFDRELAEVAHTLAAILRKPKAAPKSKGALSDILSAETLTAALKRVMGAMEARNSIPVLSCVLLESNGGTLRLSGTDLDRMYVEVLRSLGAELPKFKMAVPAADLANALRGCKGEVTFTDASVYPEAGATRMVMEGYGPDRQEVLRPIEPDLILAVSVGGSEAKFKGLPATDFPVMLPPSHYDGKPVPAISATMPLARLLEPLKFIRPAISLEETRYYLNGVYMHVIVKEGAPRLTFVATDGSRLMKDEGEDGAGFGRNMPGVILPRATVEWAVRHLAGDEVQVDVWKEQVRLTTAMGTYVTKVIDGSFPDYNRVIPGERAPTVISTGDAKSVAATLVRLASQTKEKSGSIRLILEKGAVIAMARNMEGGSIRADLANTIYVGQTKEISFNGRYIADLMQAGGDIPVTMDIAGPNDPSLFLYDGMPGRCAVLMPLRV